MHRLAHSTAALSPSSPAQSGANACMCDVAHGRLQSCCGSHINQLVDDVFSLLDVDKSGFATEKAMCDFLCEQLAADESYAGAVSPAGGRLPAPALASPSPWRLAWSDSACRRRRTYMWYLSGDQARFAATDPWPVQQRGRAFDGGQPVCHLWVKRPIGRSANKQKQLVRMQRRQHPRRMVGFRVRPWT